MALSNCIFIKWTHAHKEGYFEPVKILYIVIMIFNYSFAILKVKKAVSKDCFNDENMNLAQNRNMGTMKFLFTFWKIDRAVN